MDRREEIRELFALSVEELIEKSDGRLKVLPTNEDLYVFLAEELAAEFERAAAGGRKRAYIMPVGPTQPYHILAETLNRKRISLRNVVWFFMDEYCDDNGDLVPEDYPISFRRQIGPLFFDHIDPALVMPPEQVIFPTPENLSRLPGMIEQAGGIELCFGGIGIHGHVAFNEPEPGVKDTDPRVLEINEFTRTIDAVRHPVGGNLINFPRKAITLGMRQVLGARRLLLMTRNDTETIFWANTVLRLSVLGEPGDDYPVTHIRNHPDYVVATNRHTAEAPKIIL